MFIRTVSVKKKTKTFRYVQLVHNYRGKYQKLGNGLEAKEVIVGGDSEARRRFVVVRNPEEAERDKKKRDDILTEVERRLNELRQLSDQYSGALVWLLTGEH